MDVDIKDIHATHYKSKKSEEILEKLDAIISNAEETRDRKDVDDPELLRAMKIVEDFLRLKKRICYGGTAINAQLPKDKKIYDFTRELPDYDFYTPTPSKDIDVLVSMLKEAGLVNTSVRLGVNKGTIKLSVDFNPVADLTYTPLWFYNELLTRAFVEDGIYYADADFLRMNMYLELSRPLGEVDRWKKVYQRLVLLSDNQKIDTSTCSLLKKTTTIPNKTHQIMLDYVMDNKLVFLGEEVEEIYKHPKTFNKKVIDNSTNPVIVLSPNPENDANNLKTILEEYYDKKDLHILHLKQVDDHLHDLAGIPYEDTIVYLPTIYGIVYKKTVLFLGIEQHICHSYNPVPYKKKTLCLASLDTCIYIYYLLSYLHELDGILSYTFECFAKRLVGISHDTRDRDSPGIFPLFPTQCSGAQSGIRSLLKHKVGRVKAYKAAEKIRKLRITLRNTKNKTKSAKKSSTKKTRI